MEAIRILWIIAFFLFTLILIFVWSKIIVIANKIRVISDLVEKSDKINSEMPVIAPEAEADDN